MDVFRAKTAILAVTARSAPRESQFDALNNLVDGGANARRAQLDRARAGCRARAACGRTDLWPALRTFADEGESMAALLAALRQHLACFAGVSAWYLDELKAAFSTAPAGWENDMQRMPERPPESLAASSLSAREVEILDYVARGLSNKEIARPPRRSGNHQMASQEDLREAQRAYANSGGAQWPGVRYARLRAERLRRPRPEIGTEYDANVKRRFKAFSTRLHQASMSRLTRSVETPGEKIADALNCAMSAVASLRCAPDESWNRRDTRFR